MQNHVIWLIVSTSVVKPGGLDIFQKMLNPKLDLRAAFANFFQQSIFTAQKCTQISF